MESTATNRAWPGFLTGTAIIFYLVAIQIPVATIHQQHSNPIVNFFVGKESRDLTLSQAIEDLVEGGEIPLAVVLIVFTIVFPVCKLLALGVAVASPAARTLPVFRLLNAIGKWSMLDVFVVALLVVAVKFAGMGIGSITVRPGLAVFFFSVLLAMLAGHVLSGSEDQEAEGVRNAQPRGLLVRGVAVVIDAGIAALVTLPMLLETYGETYFESEELVQGPTDLLLSWVLPLVVTVLFWAAWGATPGKMAMGVRIVDARTGGSPRLWQLLVRYFGYYLSALPIGLGFVWAAFDRRKQAWHDKLARTLVVRGSLVPAGSVVSATATD